MKHEINSNRLLMLSLTLCLTLVSANLSAQESLVTGISETESDTIYNTNPNDLVTKTVLIPNSYWHCAVTASAESINPLDGDDNKYIFGLQVDDPNSTRSGSDRTIDHDNLSGEEAFRVEVSSTYFFSGLTAGEHTFYWSARKEQSSVANMAVDDSSMTVVCSDHGSGM
jgi:hypothetical protein